MKPPALVLAAHCVVCGVPFSGLAGALLKLRGVHRSPRNPNCCTRCNAHLEDGRLVEMTVLFADLSSFTEMTGRLGAAETYSVVDEFLRLASITLTSHGALIDKYIGDAVMAFFNVPIKRADHAAAAVAAAGQLQSLLPELSKRLEQPLKASIGIAVGYARVGRLGSDDIKDYTAIGDAVNQAARLQAQARATEIVVSDGVYREVAAAYPGVAPESLTLKGFSQKSVAYRLNGAPATPHDGSRWLEGRPAMSWGAVALALVGSGCLGTSLASAMALVFGAGWATSLWALARLFDHSPLRQPVLAVSTLLAVAMLVSLDRQRLFRRQLQARNACLAMTRSEKRNAWLAAGMAVTALALVVIELAVHSRFF